MDDGAVVSVSPLIYKLPSGPVLARRVYHVCRQSSRLSSFAAVRGELSRTLLQLGIRLCFIRYFVFHFLADILKTFPGLHTSKAGNG